MTIDDGTSSPRRLTAIDQASARNPAWSPDSRWIAFRKAAESPDVWLLDTTSWSATPFEEHPADEFWVQWSVDGSRLYFSSDRDGVFNIFVKPLHGETPATRVTNYRRGDPTGMPETNLYTPFAVGADRLILPLETRRGEIYALEASSSEP